jgi:copper chaperone
VETRRIDVQGMVGEEDARRVRDALKDVWGIQKVEVVLERGEAIFSYDEKAGSFVDCQQAIIDQGFEIYTNHGIAEKKVNGDVDQDIVPGDVEQKEV